LTTLSNGNGALIDRFQPVITSKKRKVGVQFDFLKAGSYGTTNELQVTF
jgi:hypothetical protein